MNWRLLRFGIASLGVLIGIVAVGELAARIFIGAPALSIVDAQTEYMFAPNQNGRRFSNSYAYNSQGMRGSEIPNDGREIILVLGDSVVNGGAPSDQLALGTSIASDQQTWFGNVSAGSWGPGNIKGWIRKYGWEGNTAIVVLSTHDLRDQPTCEPLSAATHPTKRPKFLLFDTAKRYAPRFLPSIIKPMAISDSSQLPCKPSSRSATDDILWILDDAKKNRIRTCFIHHTTLSEAQSPPSGDAIMLWQVFKDRTVPSIKLIDYVRQKTTTVESAYRDDIHLSNEGQAVLAVALRACHQKATLPQ